MKNKIKNKIYQTVETVPKSNSNIVDINKIDTPYMTTQLESCIHFKIVVQQVR